MKTSFDKLTKASEERHRKQNSYNSVVVLRL